MKINKIIFLLILILSIPLINFSRFKEGQLNKSDFNKDLKSSGSPIIITNWSDTCAIYDWCFFENGFYVVSDLNLNLSISGTGLIIENTTEPFIIKNCNFLSPDLGDFDTGIKLVNASNGILINNSFYLARNSIVIRNSINNSIIVNRIESSKRYSLPDGIVLEGCINSFIQENFINFNYYGLELTKCKNIQIFNNVLEENSWGIVCRSTTNCTIFNNTIHEISHNGITFTEKCYYNFIIENIISNKYYKSEYQDGIGLWYDSSNNTIQKNTIKNNGRYGMDIRDSLNNKVINNTLLKNKWGIRLFKSNYTTVKYNYITYYQNCILETNCELNIIEDNICEKLPSIIPGYYLWIIFIISIMSIVLIMKRNLRNLQ